MFPSKFPAAPFRARLRPRHWSSCQPQPRGALCRLGAGDLHAQFLPSPHRFAARCESCRPRPLAQVSGLPQPARPRNAAIPASSYPEAARDYPVDRRRSLPVRQAQGLSGADSPSVPPEWVRLAARVLISERAGPLLAERRGPRNSALPKSVAKRNRGIAAPNRAICLP